MAHSRKSAQSTSDSVLRVSNTSNSRDDIQSADRYPVPRVVDNRDLHKGMLLTKKRLKEVKNKFEKYPELGRFALKRNKCDIISVGFKPDETNLDALAIKSKSAYVLNNNELYYVDKENNTVSKLEISQDSLDEFKKMNPQNNRMLSTNELNQVKSITGHVPKKLTCIKFSDTKGNHTIIAAYKGEKRGKLLGKGGLGKVKVGQRIDNRQWVALKVSNYNKSSREYEFLEKLGRTAGKVIHVDKNKKRKELIAMNYVPGINVEKLISGNELVICDSFAAHTSKYGLNKKAIYIFKDVVNKGEFKLKVFESGVWKERVIDDNTKNTMNGILNHTYIQNLSSNGVLIENENIEAFRAVRNALNLPSVSKPSITAINPFEIAVGMMNAVKELHDLNIIHRDIKPEQFIYDPDTKKMILIDVGNAMYVGEKSIVDGTPLYYPIEIIQLLSKNLHHQEKTRVCDEWMKINPNKGKTDFEEAYNKYLNSLGYYRDKWRKDNNISDHDWQNNINNCNATYKAYYDQLTSGKLTSEPNYVDDNKQFRAWYNQVRAKVQAESKANEKYFGNETDVYSLGLSIGNVFGLVDVINSSDLFKPPEYDVKIAAFYQIKDIESARKNNVHQLDDASLVDLVTLLQAMTNIDPAKRPSLDGAMAQFKVIQDAGQQLHEKHNVSSSAHILSALLPSSVLTKAAISKIKTTQFDVDDQEGGETIDKKKMLVKDKVDKRKASSKITQKDSLNVPPSLLQPTSTSISTSSYSKWTQPIMPTKQKKNVQQEEQNVTQRDENKGKGPTPTP